MYELKVEKCLEDSRTRERLGKGLVRKPKVIVMNSSNESYDCESKTTPRTSVTLYDVDKLAAQPFLIKAYLPLCSFFKKTIRDRDYLL